MTPALATAPPLMFSDPPHINWGRSVPPESEWPGTRKGEQEVIEACGDGRDWFRYWHRQNLQNKFWARYDQQAAKHKDADYTKNFEWNQRLIIGIYGAGKTVMGVLDGLYRINDGFPYFDNGAGLVGWTLRGVEIFTAMARIPKGSQLLFDEAHTTMPGKLGGATAVMVCESLGANIRKNNIKWDIVSAHHDAVHPAIRRRCQEVIRPFKLRVQAPPRRGRVKQWDNDANFHLGWDVWEGEPFNDPEVLKHGVDAKDPDYWVTVHGEAARNAFCLTDSFRLVDAGAALLADKDAIKDDLRALQGGTAPETAGHKVSVFIESVCQLDDHSGYVSTRDLASLVGINVQSAGMAIADLYGVAPLGNLGYPLAELVQAHHRRVGDPDLQPDALSALMQRREASKVNRRQPVDAALLEYVKGLSMTDYEAAQFVKPGQIAKKIGFDPRAIGVAAGKLFGVQNVQNKGYRTCDLVDAYHEYEEV